MKRKNQSQAIKRRSFLKTGVGLTAGSLFLGMGSSRLYGAARSNHPGADIKTVTLNNGVEMPILGFGTSRLKGDLGVRCVSDAISVGYRLFDTAAIYGTEEAVGGGIKKSGIDRKEVFVTSKVWESGYDNAMKSFQTSLNRMGLDYLDLFLIHRPQGDVKGTWKAMEDLYDEGKIRVLGVSNFEENHIEELMSYAKIKPAVNQIESHAFFHQDKANEWLQKDGIQMEAWAPFARGRNKIFINETLAEVGKKYNKSNAQVSLRFHYQRGIVSIPRTSKKYHMMENLDIFNFELDEGDMRKIDSLDLNTTQFPEWS